MSTTYKDQTRLTFSYRIANGDKLQALSTSVPRWRLSTLPFPRTNATGEAIKSLPRERPSGGVVNIIWSPGKRVLASAEYIVMQLKEHTGLMWSLDPS